MKEKKQSNKKKGLITVIVVFSVILICAAGYLVIKNLGLFGFDNPNKKVQESFAPDLPIGTSSPEGYYLTIPEIPTSATSAATPAPSVSAAPSTAPASAAAVQQPVNNPIDFEGLMALNSDVYSWIYIPDTNVSLPVAQSLLDDNFYLDHDVYKDYSFPGAIYSQSMNSREYTDRVTVLYGHNMNDGSMFANLHMFEDEGFFNSHPYFYIYTKDRKLTYEVISAHDYDSKHILNSYNFADDSTFQSWLDNAQNPHSVYANVRSGLNLDLNSKILVLSTCENGGDGRYLVQGVLISDEKTQ